MLPAQIIRGTTTTSPLYDRETGEPIPYTTISAETPQSVTSTTSDDKGAFTIKLQREFIVADSIALQIDYLGYEDCTLPLDKY